MSKKRDSQTLDKEQMRQLLEEDLYSFAQAMYPNRYYGDIHKKIFQFWTRPDSKNRQMTLIPRDHQKSHCIAVWCAWWIVKHPDVRVIYVSANPDLAAQQLGVIKDILTSPTCRYFWPELLNYEIDRGELKHKPKGKWTEDLLTVDHPLRAESRVADPTVRATSAKSTNTGYHCDVTIFDDLVTEKNYSTEAGRGEVSACYKAFSSIGSTDSIIKIVGTRYSDKDLYSDLSKAVVPMYDDDGNIIDEEPLYEMMVEQVEDRGDGTGQFLWPRMQLSNGKWYGFDRKQLAIKKADYTAAGDIGQFYAQYYNNPNDVSLHRLTSDKFVYYDPKYLHRREGAWFFKDKKLSIAASCDLAFSNSKKADYTAIAVVGADSDGYIYILEIDRFRSTKVEDYYSRVIEMHHYWGFKRLRIETNAGGHLVKTYIEDRVRQEGGSLILDAKHQNDKSKQERIALWLEPRYENKTILHAQSGMTKLLEEELILPNPPHDDMKDALAAALEVLKIPSKRNDYDTRVVNIRTHSRFGGRVR